MIFKAMPLPSSVTFLFSANFDENCDIHYIANEQKGKNSQMYYDVSTEQCTYCIFYCHFSFRCSFAISLGK